MKNLEMMRPLLMRVFIIFLSALGGWLAGQYPAEIKSLCGGVL